MDIERALTNLGSPGTYNVLSYSIFFTINAFVAFNHVALSSIYAVSIPHKCDPAESMQNSNASLDLINNITNGIKRKQNTRILRCSLEIYSNNSHVEIKKCNKWRFSYPHGISNTWVNEFVLVCDKKFVTSMSTSLYMAGVMIGSIFIGMASDQYGRRPALLWSLGISFVLCLSMAFIPNLIALIVIRCFLGVFLAGTHGIVYILPIEITAKKYKSVVSVFVLNSFGVSAVVGCLVCWLVKDWRMIQVILSVPAGISLILAYLFIPESPRWNLIHKKHKKNATFFTKAMKINKIKGNKHDEVKVYLAQSQEPSTMTTKQRHHTILDVFRTPKIRKRSFIGIYLWFTAGISYYALVLNMQTLSNNPFLAILIGAATDLPSFILAFVYVPRLGKRRSLIVLMLLGSTGCLTYAIYNSMVILLIGKSFVAASFGVVFIYLPEIYPTVVRNIGVGTLSLFARFGSMLAPQLVLLGTYTLREVPVVVVGSLSLLAGILAIFAPETKDKELPNSIEEIELKNRNVTLIADEQRTSLM